MNNILNKSCTNKEYADFALYCNENNLHIEATETDYYALESYQTIRNNEVFDLRNDEDYIVEQAQKERERIDNLTVTKRVFALALQSFGITYTQLKEIIATNETAQLEWDLCERLQRKNPLLDSMCSLLGLTSTDLDNIFIQANNLT